jgi:hypothetical protein
MGKDTCGELRVERCDRREHVGATLRMRSDRPPLGACQMRVLVNDVEQRFVNLSDIVEERDAFNDTLLVGVELRGVGNDQGIRGDATYVRAGLCVVRVDRVEQRFETGSGKSLGRLSAPAFTYEHRTAKDASDGGQKGAHAG